MLTPGYSKLDAGDDIDASIIKAGKISFESGVNEDQKDLLIAADSIASGLAAAKKVIDYEAFVKLFAMEILLKHRDGFTVNTNNTYLYNDVKAVAEPTISDVNLKFIPCGLDQLLRKVKDFEIGQASILGRLIYDDAAGKADLYAAIRTFATTIFSKSAYDTVLKPYVDRLEALVASAGGQPTEEVNSLRHELKLVRSGAFQHLGEFPTEAISILARQSGDSIHASKTDNSHSHPQEVYHDGPSSGPSDLWIAVPSKSSSGINDTMKFQNQAHGTWLHADATTKIYGLHTKSDPGNDFVVEPTVSTFGPAPRFMTGYFRLKSKVTGNYVSFCETEKIESVKMPVCQVGDSEAATVFYIF